MTKKSKKGRVAVPGLFQPVSLDFLRSRACAEMSPLAAKLLLDLMALMGPNATRNGDLSLAPKTMFERGWTSRSSLLAAVQELLDFGLLMKTRQGSRLDCSLYACTLYPLDCDLNKIDVRPGCYRHTDYMGEGTALADIPTESKPARWRRARKTQTVAPTRDEAPLKRPATGQTHLTKTGE